MTAPIEPTPAPVDGANPTQTIEEVTPPADDAPVADVNARTITGIILTGEDFANPDTGEIVRFLPESITEFRAGQVPLCIQHDITKPIGILTESNWDADGNLVGTFKISAVPEGDQQLQLANDKVLGGLSGRVVNCTVDGDGNITAGQLMEVSVVTHPHLTGSTISAVALAHQFSKDNPKPVRIEAKETKMTDKTPVDTSLELSAPVPQPVPLIGASSMENPYPHLFSGNTAKPEHSFFEDLRLAATSGAARDRIQDFRLAVTTQSTALAPRDPQTRETLPFRDADNPLSDSITTGSIDDDTPFYVLSYNASGETNLVNPHVEGVEPVLGDLGAWTRQLVTPHAVSGKIAVTREAFMAKTNPRVEAQAFARFETARKRAIEVALAAYLDGLSGIASYSIAGADPVGGTIAALMGTQATVNADRFNAALFNRNAFAALIAQKDTTGRPMLAPVNPSNAYGTTARGFTSVDVNGTSVRGVNGITNSYLIDSSVVEQYTSPVLEFTFDYEVAWVRLGVFQLQASVVTDLGGVVRLTR